MIQCSVATDNKSAGCEVSHTCLKCGKKNIRTEVFVGICATNKCWNCSEELVAILQLIKNQKYRIRLFTENYIPKSPLTYPWG